MLRETPDKVGLSPEIAGIPMDFAFGSHAVREACGEPAIGEPGRLRIAKCRFSRCQGLDTRIAS